MSASHPPTFWPEGLPRELDLPDRPLAENLLRSAARVPEKPAIRYYGGVISFAELAEAARRLAGWLRGPGGVAPGDRVMLHLQNSPQFVIGYYAVLLADAVVVPVNPMCRTDELRWIASDTGARLAICGQELFPQSAPLLEEGVLPAVLLGAYGDYADPAAGEGDLPPPLDAVSPDAPPAPGVTLWAQALAHDPRQVAPERRGGDLALIVYSSGTTGKPKGCMHSHDTAHATMLGGLTWNPIRSGAPSLVSLPLYHVTGMQNSMNGPIMAGETMVMMTRWDRRLAARLIHRHQVARWRNITTMVIDLLEDPELDPAELQSLQMIGGGGAAMPEAVAARLKDMTGLDYIEGYGMSETLAATHINPPSAPRRQCLGVPVFGVDSRVIDPQTGAELPPGETGEIVINAPQVMLGYWNAPEATAAAQIELGGKRYLRTGDIGHRDEAGYFYLTDRLKRMISVSGFKVWPAEVEAALHHHPNVAEACIVARPDPRKGEAVTAYVVPRGTLDPEGLRAWARERLAAYKVPSEVRVLDALPRGASGKVLWRELQAQRRAEGAAGRGAQGKGAREIPRPFQAKT